MNKFPNNTYKTYKILLDRKNKSFEAFLGISNVSSSEIFASTYRQLHAEEVEAYNDIILPEKKNQYLRTNHLYKKLFNECLSHEANSYKIRHGVFGQPLLGGNWGISLSHTQNWSSCLIFPDEHPMAIDIEKIEFNAQEKIISQLSNKEINIAKNLTENKNTSYICLWTVKEALSKVLKTGLMTPFQLFEINTFENYEYYTEFTFKNFEQYKVRTYIFYQSVMSIVFPQATNLELSFSH